jgi:hypothetical protein
MPGSAPLKRADILIVSWQHFLPGESGVSRDHVWEALCSQFGKVPSGPRERHGPSPYNRNGDQFLPELRNHKSWQESQDRRYVLHPTTDGQLGEFHEVAIAAQSPGIGRTICLFHSALRINTDGPTLPVVRLLKQVLEEVRPRLAIAVGLGGGVTADHQVGDVIAARNAEYQLRGELAGSNRNGWSNQSGWTVPSDVLAGIQFAALREPALVAPSPNYDHSTPAPQPPQHQPTIRLATHAIRTCPLLTDHGHVVGSPGGSRKDLNFRTSHAATDMDAASFAEACAAAETAHFMLLLGLNVPAITELSPADLRYAWIDVFTSRYAAAAATNVALVAHAIATKG